MVPALNVPVTAKATSQLLSAPPPASTRDESGVGMLLGKPAGSDPLAPEKECPKTLPLTPFFDTCRLHADRSTARPSPATASRRRSDRELTVVATAVDAGCAVVGRVLCIWWPLHADFAGTGCRSGFEKTLLLHPARGGDERVTV